MVSSREAAPVEPRGAGLTVPSAMHTYFAATPSLLSIALAAGFPVTSAM
jgi:hypothetical protein